GLCLRGELMIDDLAEETSARPTKIAYQWAAQVSMPAGRQNTNLLFEFTRVWNHVYSVYYSDLYDRNHTHQGEPLGYWLGPDSRRYYGKFSVDVSPNLEVGATVDIINKGSGSLDEPWLETMGGVDASVFSTPVRDLGFFGLFLRILPRDNIQIRCSAEYGGIEEPCYWWGWCCCRRHDGPAGRFWLWLDTRW
ncbi:MAG: hypothetical protein V2A71_02580, partial [Candidatus Eisenbacteria bacterium]